MYSEHKGPLVNINELRKLVPGMDKICLEIGFGHGEFLFYLLETKPDYTILGVEIASKYFKKVLKRVLREEKKNIFLLKEDARSVLYYGFPPASIDEIYINFPDPWPKSKQKKRRLTYEKNLLLILSRLKKGGVLYFSTDSPVLRDDLYEFIEKYRVAHEILSSSPFEIKTKYERKWRNLKKDIFYFIIRKGEENFKIVEGEVFEDMPHVIFKGSGDLTKKIFEEFTPFEEKSDGIFIKFQKPFISADGTVLLPVMVNEEFINQIVFAEITFKKGDFILKLYEKDRIIVTGGVLKALRLLKNYLESKYRIEVKKSNI